MSHGVYIFPVIQTCPTQLQNIPDWLNWALQYLIQEHHNSSMSEIKSEMQLSMRCQWIFGRYKLVFCVVFLVLPWAPTSAPITVCWICMNLHNINCAPYHMSVSCLYTCWSCIRALISHFPIDMKHIDTMLVFWNLRNILSLERRTEGQTSHCLAKRWRFCENMFSKAVYAEHLYCVEG